MNAKYIYELLIGAFTLVILLACNALVPLPTAMPSLAPATDRVPFNDPQGPLKSVKQ